MAEQKINRQAWAEIVAAQIKAESGGNKTAYATLVGSTYKNVNRWLACEVDVSEESVRKVANALAVDPMPMLVQIGYYRPAPDDSPPPIDTEDPAIQEVRNSTLQPRRKRKLIERIAQMQEEDRQRRLQIARWTIEHSDT